MLDRETSGDTTKDCEQTAYYTLELELKPNVEYVASEFVKLVNVSNHSLRSGFMVVEYAGGEQWFKAGNIMRVTKNYI